jgi:hypothetical protein
MNRDSLPPCGDDRKTQLSRYVDDELAPDERARLDEHLADCTPCRELLAVFQRNETLLGGSLATEKFGGEVIESVMAEIRRDGPSAEARPVEDGIWEWLRARPLLSSAATALLAAGLVGLAMIGQGSKLGAVQTALGRTQHRLEELGHAQQEIARAAADQADEYERLIRGLRAEDALRQAPERWMLAYVEPSQPHHLVVRASFNRQVYHTFDVYRRDEQKPDEAYRRLNGDRRLPQAEYVDGSAVPGQGYVYKFRAYRSGADADFVESLPVALRLPVVPGLAPERSLRLRCEEVARNLKLAVFTLERFVQGRTVAERFHVEPGQRIGEVRDVPGAGRIDFRTNLVLDRLEEGNQTLAVSYTEAVLGPDGRPVLKRLADGGAFVPETVQRDEVLSVRSNLRCQLRSVDGPAESISLWKGGWLKVRAAD